MTIGAIDVHGVLWREVPRGGDPLFQADPPSDGRWQRGDVVGGIYFADSEETAWAEWYRALAEFAIPPERQMPRDLWRWQLDVEGEADLSMEDALRSVGLTRPSPTQSGGRRSRTGANDFGVRVIAGCWLPAPPVRLTSCSSCSVTRRRSPARSHCVRP